MRAWSNLLGGPLLWAAHFFAVYIIASVLPGTDTAARLVLGATAAALALMAWLLAKTIRVLRESTDDLQRWSSSLAVAGYALAGVAITYQGMPAVIT